MHGFGSFAFSFIHAANERSLLGQSRLRSMHSFRNLGDAEVVAGAIGAKNRERAQRDLFEAIWRGSFPRWMLPRAVLPPTGYPGTPCGAERCASVPPR
jgi:catalase